MRSEHLWLVLLVLKSNKIAMSPLPESRQVRLTPLGVKLLVRAVLGLLLGAVIVGLLFFGLFSTFMSRNTLFLVLLAIAVILCWLSTKLAAMIAAASNEWIFDFFEHHLLYFDKNKFTLKPQMFGICYEFA